MAHRAFRSRVRRHLVFPGAVRLRPCGAVRLVLLPGRPLAARCLAALVSGASRGGTLRASRERLKVRAAALTGAGAES
jgi:hypothetical protein